MQRCKCEQDNGTLVARLHIERMEHTCILNTRQMQVQAPMSPPGMLSHNTLLQLLLLLLFELLLLGLTCCRGAATPAASSCLLMPRMEWLNSRTMPSADGLILASVVVGVPRPAALEQSRRATTVWFGSSQTARCRITHSSGTGLARAGLEVTQLCQQYNVITRAQVFLLQPNDLFIFSLVLLKSLKASKPAHYTYDP